MRFHPNIKDQLKNSFSMLAIGTGIFTGYCLYSGNVKFYHQIVMPAAHSILPPENAHRLAVVMGKYGLFPRYSNKSHPELKCHVFGLEFPHPVGVAAGFDKHGECPLNLLKMGFSHVEIGSVTPEPQSGNDKPRVFRLMSDKGIINRYGFNSDGHSTVYDRLKNLEWKGKGIIGINLGVNKTSTNPIHDYVQGVQLFGELADYLVINVSSPNTPGLRSLQQKDSLKAILKDVLQARNKLQKRTPLLLKISPDESENDIIDIINVVMDPEYRVDGFVVSNTSISRENLSSPLELTSEKGGLSGIPIAEKSTNLIAKVSSLTNKSIPIIGVGGIDSGQEAFKKMMAGASLVQLYTSMTYYGPPIVKKVTEELYTELINSPCNTVDDLLVARNQDKVT